MTDKKFGRIVAPDTRDSKFLMSAVLPQEVTRTSRYWNANGWWGDQGQTSQCVGFSWAHWVEDGPVTRQGMPPAAAPEDIYNDAQLIDEWEGTNYDGTSVRAGAKILQQKGFITEYRWAWDLQTLIDAVLTKGPVVVGTYWYSGMLQPDVFGHVKATGWPVGGHAYLINGVNTKLKRFRLKNSWGRTWGRRGQAYISFEDMDKLIKEQGEVCLAIEK